MQSGRRCVWARAPVLNQMAVTAFLVSIIAGLVLTSILVSYGRRRAPGTYLTWGEAFAGATFVFAIFVLAYGVIPHQWLVWCDKELAWRRDKIGIPLGPLAKIYSAKEKHKLLGFIPVEKNSAWPKGITFFGRGRVTINAEQIRDTVVSVIYIGFMGVQFSMWSWWQKRGKIAKAKVEREALASSAYGRPLKRAEA